MDPIARSRLRLLVSVLLLAASVAGLPVQEKPLKVLRTYDQRQEGPVNVQIELKDVSVVAAIDSSVFDDNLNYDYVYDYADFTIKPKPSPKPKPSSTTPSSSSQSPGLPEPILTILSGQASSSPKPLADEAGSTASPGTTQATSASAETAPAGLPSLQIRPVANVSLEGDSASPISAPPQQDVSQAAPVQQAKPSDEPSDSSSLGGSTSTKSPAEVRPYSAWSYQESSETSSSVAPALVVDPRRKCPTGFLLKSGKCFKRRLSLISPRFALMKLAPALVRQARMLTHGFRSSAAARRADRHR